MEMRSKVYPALPEAHGLRLVLPRTGDLRYRAQVPQAFAQRLYIHADPRRRFWYSRFQLTRNFIVMSTQGDLYAKRSVAIFTMADLPKQNVLTMPRVARGDLVKVLDYALCSRSEGQQHWEIVFTRWRNGMETWLPLEVVQLFAPELLQEFYVSSINSWAFHQRVHAGNLSAYQTEVELWLFHPEFQEFYKRLRQKRAGGRTPTAQAHHQPIQSANNVRVKAEQAAMTAANIPRTAPAQQPPQPVQPAAVAAVNDRSEGVILEFEQRRLARERQEQLDRSRRNQLAQRRLEREQREQLHQSQEQQEREQRLQHERQRQKAHEELQKKQKEYQERLRVQQEREKMTELQKQEQERQRRAKEQELLRHRLQQDTIRQPAARKQAPTSRAPQKSATRTLLRHKERQTNSFSQPQHKGRSSSSIWTKDGDDEYVPPEESESEDSGVSDFSAESDASEDSMSDQRTRKRRQKRLLYSQVELDDEDDDDFPDLSQPPPSPRRKSMRRDGSEDEISARKATQTSKKRKRLRQPSATVENGGDSRSAEVDLTQLSDDDEDDEDNSAELATPTPVATPEDGKESDGNVQASSVDVELVDADADADADDDIEFEPSMIVGEIRCVCGATAVGAYRGEWLQCWKEDCGVWEHADCVGFLTSFESYPPPKYVCTRCDSAAYLARCVNASNRILDWLFQCCDSRNTKQLMELLEGNTGAANLPSDWKNEHLEGRTLAMQAARNGLVKCLRYLMDKRKVDVFATDAQSRNVLHHAALGGSVMCCRVLLKYDRKLLLHQDLRGRMPFHCMLQSAAVNQLCIPFIREDSALVGMGDLNSNFPVHYACQAVNRHTVRICRMIFNFQPSMLQEKSSEGLSPVMILCKSAGRASVGQNRAINTGEVTQSAKDVIAVMLDIDVFGDCLNEKAPNGWSPLHFAAAAGNHELVTHLCNTELFDVQEPAKGTRLTALHIAAQENHPVCIRALLAEGFDVVAKDTDGWIPMLYAQNTECIQELMHYKLTKQLSRLHRMLSKYQQRGLVRRWQRLVARDPTCFDILNDWCQADTERIERMEGLLLSNPFLLRLDNKIEYVRTYIIPSIKSSPGESPVGSEHGTSGTGANSKVQKKLAFVFTRGSGCFWKQFVGMGASLESEDFRLPILFSIERGGGNSQGTENRDSNMKLVLIRLAAGLLKEFPGLLVRGPNGELNKTTLSSDKQKLAAQLLGFYLLGELVAHFVLFSVPLSGILDFAPEFLRCIGCNGLYKSTSDASWENAGRSFSAGFGAVLPAALDIFLADDLRVLFNGPETSLNALQIDWNSAVNGAIEESDVAGGQVVLNAKSWLPRIVCELVQEEQQLLLLFMAGTFQLINERFFRSGGGTGGIAVASYPATDGVLDHDMLYPSMEHKPDILRLPSYSCYAAFKKAMLAVIRHANEAFRPE